MNDRLCWWSTELCLISSQYIIPRMAHGGQAEAGKHTMMIVKRLHGLAYDKFVSYK
jgi:hypothetical protein